ncbi:MAG TPA: 3-phosphoshikimate 1-carboxyvinyltransferase [Terriglobales bacterium]|jgi:3-phosphoshikimate 1-carboxyvinyltransferase|nr:3-phosphoshikimate 1-carboxyvinyltransferase [Terriglobales bacterium]
MTESSTVVVRPARNVAGSLRLPGDKSISHRYAMLAAIAEGPTRLENFSTGADCASTLGCLNALGVQWERDGTTVVVHGRGPVLQPPAAALECGNSGSTMRMLSGILAGQRFSSELSGDESLSRRPMARIITPLTAMGARITAAAGERPPLRITGGPLQAIEYKVPVASAQVKSAILFAGLFANGETRVEEPLRTRDHGELALRAFGADVRQQGNQARLAGGQMLHAIAAHIPGDISSAAFFLCAAALFPSSRLVLDGLLLNPTRARLLDVLMAMGARITVTQIEEQYGELAGTVRIEGAELRGTTIFGSDTAALIDEIPVLATIAPYTEEGVEIRDARELRVKESDRIAALATNLRAMGAQVQEHEDGVTIPGRQILHGAEIDSLGDHRIAMAFAVAALRATGETSIQKADAAVISYPGFFEALESIVQR